MSRGAPIERLVGVARTEGRADDVVSVEGGPAQRAPVQPLHSWTAPGQRSPVKPHQIVHELDGVQAFFVIGSGAGRHAVLDREGGAAGKPELFESNAGRVKTS